ncbi:hypothetical protein GcM1_169007 [Golovinomyces cichoracearum]|uniref:Uncharacterized protein n=1 Tax=Golovinomyces cichoracearum TaxID=62708 RepID=A0A420J759_9PEZI|nr:hypothetical protein GcM1_169007 [Golovinomyces cichoracearum]
MSSRGLSKADRYIIAQGKMAANASNEKTSVVDESSGLEKPSRSIEIQKED